MNRKWAIAAAAHRQWRRLNDIHMNVGASRSRRGMEARTVLNECIAKRTVHMHTRVKMAIQRREHRVNLRGVHV